MLDLLNNDPLAFVMIILGLVLFVGLIFFLVSFFKSPFSYPYFLHDFDVSGKRNPQIEDWIDEYFIHGGFAEVQRHQGRVDHWKHVCQERVEKSVFKKQRRKQYQECLDDANAFVFRFLRKQTRYKQSNYVKTAYQVMQPVENFVSDYSTLKKRDEELKSINYECTLRSYHSKSQRKLLTKELKRKIMERDNYTCQLCGKYMPDEIGLHIDHIVPVASGGKSVPSNLQVLCSKCNGQKSNKFPHDART